MGKRKMSRIISAIVMCTVVMLLLTPLALSGNTINRADIYGVSVNNSPYQSDFKSTTYHEDYVTHHYRISYSGLNHMYQRFSGIETYWDPNPGGWTDPSTHKALCNRGWSSVFHENDTALNAYNRLNEDCMFVFYGHGDHFNLKIGGGGYLCDQPNLGH